MKFVVTFLASLSWTEAQEASVWLIEVLLLGYKVDQEILVRPDYPKILEENLFFNQVYY